MIVITLQLPKKETLKSFWKTRNEVKKWRSTDGLPDIVQSRALVVPQLAERPLLTPEVRGSDPTIDKFLYRTHIHLLSTVLKRGREWPILKKHSQIWSHSLICIPTSWRQLGFFFLPKHTYTEGCIHSSLWSASKTFQKENKHHRSSGERNIDRSNVPQFLAIAWTRSSLVEVGESSYWHKC